MSITSNTPGSATLLTLPSKAPERLVGVGFRCWLTGLSTGDIGCWEEAFNAFSAQLGVDNARDLLIELSCFVRAVSANSERQIRVSKTGACGFCQDECLAISIIAACQHDRRSALHASASALIGSSDIGDTIIGAQSFASGLTSARQHLSLESVCPATCAVRAQWLHPL